LGRREKLIAAMRNNPKDVPFDKIKSLLLYYGCKVRQRSRGSSHYIFTHHALPYSLSVPKERPIKATYVRDVLKMVDDIIEALGED
jgi:hypothetical protein